MVKNKKVVLHKDNLQQPYAIAIDFDEQILYWADIHHHRIERSNVDGSDRSVVVSSGIDQPFDITLLGDMLYVSDLNLRILATNKSGRQPVEMIYATFCDHIITFGIQAVAEQRQLLGEQTLST